MMHTYCVVTQTSSDRAMTDTNHAPYDTQEYMDLRYWRKQAAEGELNTFPCIAAWSDICGFGNALKDAGWNLLKLKEEGLFKILSQAYSLLGKPFISGVPPMPTERILIINDGVARTTDLSDSRYIQHLSLLFYVRDLLMHHYMLERQLVEHNLGLRTVLAGGERCQYSPQKTTGHSILHYTNEPSELGKGLLEQQFVYNPAEFQMNTAFALAYSIDALGSSSGLIPNRLYIEERWLEKLNAVMPEPSVVDGQVIHFLWRGSPGISIFFDNCISIDVKGITANVFRVSRFIVHKGLEGEQTEFPMSEHDLPNA